MDHYKDDSYNEIFCYLLKTFAYVREFGRAEIPKYFSDTNENNVVIQFVNDGISLLENGLTNEVYEILLHTLFWKANLKSRRENEIEQLVLIKSIMQYIYYDNILSFFKLSNMWSDHVKHYAILNIIPQLDETIKEKCLLFI